MLVSRREYDTMERCYQARIDSLNRDIRNLQAQEVETNWRTSQELEAAREVIRRLEREIKDPAPHTFEIIWLEGVTTVRAASMQSTGSRIVFYGVAGKEVGSCPLDTVVRRLVKKKAKKEKFSAAETPIPWDTPFDEDE